MTQSAAPGRIELVKCICSEQIVIRQRGKIVNTITNQQRTCVRQSISISLWRVCLKKKSLWRDNSDIQFWLLRTVAEGCGWGHHLNLFFEFYHLNLLEDQSVLLVRSPDGEDHGHMIGIDELSLGRVWCSSDKDNYINYPISLPLELFSATCHHTQNFFNPLV